MLLKMDGLSERNGLGSDAFAALEERVLRAVEMVKAERAARAAAEARSAALEAELVASAPRAEQVNRELTLLHDEVAALRAERQMVRERVERMLGQFDALESAWKPEAHQQPETQMALHGVAQAEE